MKYYKIKKKNFPIIRYVGSLIQQDHGEALNGHGFTYWDLKTKKFAHIEIPNDYGFFTVEVNKGQLSTDIQNIPKKAKLRIKCIESIQTEIKAVLSEVRKVSDVTDVSYIRVEDVVSNKNIIDATDFNLQNVADVDYQNNLIKEYLENKKIKVSDGTLECIYGLNKELNDELKKEYTPKNIRWKPKIFEFDNMFSYGEDNFIDFSKMKGVMGLFANNASGKSSILSALSFCLFDKCDRAFKAAHILNSQKMTFRCKFNFEINGIDFFIERKAVSDKKGAVKVEVKFWKIVDGKEVELNGEARRSTNDIIRDYIGEYEDFILTVLSIQNGRDGSFVDMGQTERKDLLAQFMGLNIFDNLSNLATDKYKEVTVLLKSLNSEDYTIKLNEVENNITRLQTLIDTENTEIDRLLHEKEENNNKLIDLTKQLTNIGSDIIDITELEKQKIDLEEQIRKNDLDISNYKQQLINYESNISEINSEIKKLEDKNIKENLETYDSIKEKHSKLGNSIENKKVVIKNKLEKLSKLEEHKYDPNCDFCLNNIFVKDAIKTKEELEKDKNETISMMEIFKSYIKDLNDLSWVLTDNTTYQELSTKKSKSEGVLSKTNNDLLKSENNHSQNTNALSKINEKIDFFYQQKENIESNKNINLAITSIKSIIKNLDISYKSKNKNLMTLNSELTTNVNDKKQIQANIEKLKDLESKNDCYKYYTQAVSRDGIPYDLIIQALPTIEKEVNNILHQIVNFTITLKTDGKNVSTYLVYDDKRWPLEMGSGMEKFVSSLAIRVALINISNLPRPNFIIFDEGWGTLDANHLSEVKLLFDFLKIHFDFILIISHIDSIKDLVDNLLEIGKVNGFSQIKYL
jgi:DNA repair exonuclease SbcCD ATPase subunit